MQGVIALPAHKPVSLNCIRHVGGFNRYDHVIIALFDIGVAFGKGGCALFKGGKLFRTVPLEAAVDELITEAKAMME